jgi:hypothetical protein
MCSNTLFGSSESHSFAPGYMIGSIRNCKCVSSRRLKVLIYWGVVKTCLQKNLFTMLPWCDAASSCEGY